MLYELLRLGIIAACMIVCFAVGGIVHEAGYLLAKKEEKGGTEKPLLFRGRNDIPEVNLNENPYYDDVLANIDAYDGTSAGQKEVRRE